MTDREAGDGRAAAGGDAMPARPWPASEVTSRPIGSIREHERNPKAHSERQILLIADSIRRFGFTVPILVAEDGTIIAGHARHRAARELGLAEVPVTVARGWTEAEVRAYAIADNQLPLAGSSWDEAFLSLELEALRLDGFDLPSLGFTDEELALHAGPPDFTPAPPAAFKEYGETIAIDHVCPRCGFAWSGGKTTPAGGDGPDE